MKSEALTAKEVLHMKSDPKGRTEVPAGPPKGLYLVIQSGGAKSWAFRYRFRNKTRKLTLSKGYPALTLAAARAEAESKQDELDNGMDPAIIQAEEEAQQTPNSFESVAEEWISRHVKPNTREKSLREFQRILDADVLPKWKHKLITEITRPDILKLLDRIVDRNAPIVANRTHEVIRGLFNWSLDRGYITASPAAGTKPPSVERSRDRVLDSSELAEVWNAADGLGYPNGPFLRFSILTAQRRGEVATMRWPDVDLEKAVWTLPAEQTKSGRTHDVQLSRAAIELLTALPRFKYVDDDGEEHDGEFVWTTTSGQKPISGFSKQKERIDTEILERRRVAAKRAGLDADKMKNLTDWTVHDLRRTAATHMAEANVPPHVLAAILNHTAGSTMGVTSIYNRFRYTEERRTALEAWATFVLSLEPKADQIRPVVQAR